MSSEDPEKLLAEALRAQATRAPADTSPVGYGLLSGSDLIRILPGGQAGLGMLIPVDLKSSVRLDVTRHVYRSSSGDSGVWSFGFGISGRPRR